MIDLRRIERDLHDGAQQHLVAAAVQLRLIQRLAERPRPVGPLVAQAGESLQQAIGELRDLSHGIYPPQLTGHGVVPALRAAALSCPLPVQTGPNTPPVDSTIDPYTPPVDTTPDPYTPPVDSTIDPSTPPGETDPCAFSGDELCPDTPIVVPGPNLNAPF